MFSFLKKMHSEEKLFFYEFIFLSLMVASLPSLEAPKNIFLVSFVSIATIRQLKNFKLHSWGAWDYFYSFFLAAAFLSSVFAGYAPGDEWGGFRVVLTYITVGWLISRSTYTKQQILWLFWIIILSALAPLIWGLIQYLYLHTKPDLQLHSVGHVNHSAIYLTMIFGTCFGALIALCRKCKDNYKIFFLFAYCLLLYISLMLCQSRAAFGMATILGFLFLLIMPFVNKIKFLSIFVFTIIITITLSFNPAILEKQKELQRTNDLLSRRDLVWNVPIEASRFYPILGIGMNNWKRITMTELKNSVEKRNEIFDEKKYCLTVGHAHNLYLQALLERGFLGFSSIILFAILWVKEIILSYKRKKSTDLNNMTLYASISTFLGIFGIGLVNSTLHHENAILALLIIGLHIMQNKNLKTSTLAN
jgi:O-antigen ligase